MTESIREYLWDLISKFPNFATEVLNRKVFLIGSERNLIFRIEIVTYHVLANCKKKIMRTHRLLSKRRLEFVWQRRLDERRLPPRRPRHAYWCAGADIPTIQGCTQRVNMQVTKWVIKSHRHEWQSYKSALYGCLILTSGVYALSRHISTVL